MVAGSFERMDWQTYAFAMLDQVGRYLHQG
jgi:hypothetical protein